MTLNRTIAPPIKDAVAYPLSLKPYTFFQLSNGVEVYSVDAGPQDVMQLEFVFDAGNAYEDQNLVAASTNYMLKNGTNSRSAFSINEHFEYFGAYLNRSAYTETSTMTLHSMSKHLPELLPVLRELITESVFPQEELDIYRQNMKQRLSVNLKKSEFVAGRLIGVSLFGQEHPYGKYSSAEDFDALSREKLLAFFEQYYKKGRLRIFAAGRIPSDLEAQLEKSFGDLPLSKTGILPSTLLAALLSGRPGLPMIPMGYRDLFGWAAFFRISITLTIPKCKSSIRYSGAILDPGLCAISERKRVIPMESILISNPISRKVPG
jgi:zinc protease